MEREAEGKIDHKYVAFNQIKQIVHHKATNLRVNEGRRREIEQEHGKAINRTLTGQSAESLAADPFDSMSEEEAADRLHGLSPALYRIAIAHYIYGISVQEIARHDNLTEDAVYKRLQRARDIVTGDNNDE